MSPQRKARWLASIAAAGIEPDEATLERVEDDIAGRIDDLERVLAAHDYRASNPDYLASRLNREVDREPA